MFPVDYRQPRCAHALYIKDRDNKVLYYVRSQGLLSLVLSRYETQAERFNTYRDAEIISKIIGEILGHEFHVCELPL